MLPVEIHDGLLILGILVSLFLLMLRYRVIHMPRQQLPQPVARLDPQHHAARRVAYDDALHPLRARIVTRRPHTRQHAAPTLPEDVVVARDAEVREQVVELPHEEVGRPEGCVEAFLAQVRRVAVAELVVEDEGDVVAVGVGQGRQRQQVVVARAWSAVEQDERPARAARRKVAVDFVPRLAFLARGRNREGDGALGDFGCHFE